MRVPTALPLTLFVLLAASLGVGLAATPATAQDSPEEFDGRESVIIVELTDDGDAEWTVVEYYHLEDDEDVDRFEAFAEELRSGQRDGGYDRQTFEAMVPYAEEGTDREMSIEDAGWERATVVPVAESDAFDDEDLENGSVGALSYSVTWRNFAAVEGDRITLQDAFLTADDGTWWPWIDGDQRFVVEAPENHDFVTAPHAIDAGTLAWDGPHEFDPSDFNIVLEDRSGLLDAVQGSWLALFGGFVLLAGLGGGAAWFLLVHRDELPWPIGPGDGTEPDVVTEPADTGTDAERTGGAGEALAYDERDDDVDPELLSDEERVHRLLGQNGGRMKQATIVKETGWSNAKVSQLLSKMDEDDEIQKLRIGRENLITLPDVDPTKID